MTESPQQLPAAVPVGLEPMPDFGPAALGARFTGKAISRFWIKAGLWMLAGLAIVVSGWPVLFSDLSGILIVCVPALLCVALALKNLALARFGARPALVVDAEQLHSLAPFVRLSVRLEGISWINAIGHDLLIAARGAISKHGQPTAARWATISNAHALGVNRAELADYIAARADAVRSFEPEVGG